MLEDNQNSQFGVLIPPQLPVRLNHLTKAPVQNCDELLVAGQIQAGCGKSETSTLTLTLRPGGYGVGAGHLAYCVRGRTHLAKLKEITL